MLLRIVSLALFVLLLPVRLVAATGPYASPVLNDFFLDLNQRRAAHRVAPLQAITAAQAVELEKVLVQLRGQPANSSSVETEIHRLFPNAGRLAWLTRGYPSEPKGSELAALLQPAKGPTSSVDWFGTDFTHAALALAPQATGAGWTVFALLFENVPDYETVLLRSGQRTFFFTCPQCQKRFAGTLTGEYSQSIHCPDDGLKIAEFGRDSSSHLDHVCSFIEPFKPEDLRARTPPPGLAELCGDIWLRCLGSLSYRRHGNPDYWFRGPETWKAHVGDCKDGSVLLAAWLRAEGIPARVALGYLAEKPLAAPQLSAGMKYPGRRDADGHAWVVLPADGDDYILESTNHHWNRRVPPLARLENRYWPESQVTPNTLLVRRQTDWTSDYGNPSLWTKIPKR